MTFNWLKIAENKCKDLPDLRDFGNLRIAVAEKAAEVFKMIDKANRSRVKLIITY